MRSIKRPIASQRTRWRLFYRRLFVFFDFQGKKSVFFIGSPEALPPPLSAEEEKTLLLQLRQGEEQVRNTLIERNLRLVVYIARRFENTGIPIEDLSSIGSIGLIKAVNTFNPERNIKLATYASRCIENEILMFLRRNQRHRAEVSLDEPLNIDWDGNELLLSDVIAHEGCEVHTQLEAEVDRHLLKHALATLPERERTIMVLRFGLDGSKEATQKEVADLLGISQSYISRLEKRIIRRLRREFQRME